MATASRTQGEERQVLHRCVREDRPPIVLLGWLDIVAPFERVHKNSTVATIRKTEVEHGVLKHSIAVAVLQRSEGGGTEYINNRSAWKHV